MLAYRSSASRWLAVLCTAAFVALAGLGVGCSKDDIVGDASAEAVEAGLNDALSETVEPLAAFLGAVPTIVAGGVPFGGVVCPNTAGVCSGGGSVVCTPTSATQLTFDFDECIVATDDLPITLDGVMVATPGDPILLNLNSLFINNQPAITGTGTVSVANCSYIINVSNTNDVLVFGTIIQCDVDDYPTAQSTLTIGLDNVLVDITFDGSSVAHAEATNQGTLIANCNINLAADPISSSCSAP